MAPLRSLTIGILAVAGGLAPIGCGGDGGESAPPVTVDARQGITVTGDEYSFDPATLVVEDGGGPLEITLDNQGALAHNLRLFDGDTEIGGTETFAGGESRSGEVELGPGTYRMVCTVGDHEELGMVGKLELRQAGGGTSRSGRPTRAPRG